MKHRESLAPFTAAELKRLRKSVACMGCGAVRTGRRGKPTKIKHDPFCPVLALELGDKESAYAQGWIKRKKAA